MTNGLVGTNRRMCFWLYFTAQTSTRTCDPFWKCSAAGAANGHSSSRRPAVVHKYVGANRKEVSIPKGTRYFTSEELWIKSEPWCLHWLHRRLIIPQNVAALQNGRSERGVHRKVCYVLQAEARFFSRYAFAVLVIITVYVAALRTEEDITPKWRHAIFIFAPYINSIKTLLIVPTDAHCYKITEMLKQFKKI